MSSKKRDEKRLRDMNSRLLKFYGGRIALSGRLAPQHAYTRFYCFDCENYFLQRVFSLTVRGSITRCKCPPSDPDRRFAGSDNPKSRGHMCLAEWDCYDLTPPERLVKEPSDPV